MKRNCASWKRPLGLALMLGALLMATACTRTMDTAGTSVCAVWQPVWWSVEDTASTIRQAKANNAARAVWCD